MNLKILIVPLCVVGILVLTIGYIKPDISTLLAKRKQLDDISVQVASLDTLVSNIQSMKAQIDSSKSDPALDVTDANFLRTSYFPQSSDIEKRIDQLNFLASQSGVDVGDIHVEDVKKEDVVMAPVEDTAMDSSANILLVHEGDVSGEQLAPSVRKTYTPVIYTLTLNTTGTYDATKKLYDSIVQAKRFLTIQEVRVGIPHQVPSITKTPSHFLDAEISIEFPILPKVSIASVIGDSAFEKSKLPFDVLAPIRQNTQSVIPDLPAGELGKANLFE